MPVQLPADNVLAFYSCLLLSCPGNALVNQSLAVLANSVRPGFIAGNAYTGSLTALWANQHDIRNMQRAFEFDAARIDRSSLAGLSLFLVLGENVHTLHHYAAA